MSEKARFMAKFYEKCPYCERPFRKPRHAINSNLVKKWLDIWFNSENS